MFQTTTHTADRPAPALRLTGAPINLFNTLLWIQGLYYLATGLWPLLSIETFQLVTGPKTDNQPTGREADHWLVMTVGALVTAVALTLLVAAVRRRNRGEVGLLAALSAAALASIDIVYVVRGVIAPIYFVDAAAEILLILAWAVAAFREPRQFPERTP